jgi:hypothetical protein
MATLTSANCVFMLSITSLFPAPQQLQGFSAEDIFSTEPVDPVEVLMGVDGLLSGGWTPTPKKQTISLQADSASNLIFDAWQAAQEQVRDAYIASGFITLPSTSTIYTCVRGFLTTFSPTPDAKKILQPRRFGITWQNVFGTPV